MAHAFCEINYNTVAQLKAVYEYAKQAWEQCSGMEFKDEDEQTLEHKFKVFFNPELIKK